MSPIVFFSVAAVAWTLYAVPWSLRRYRVDRKTLAAGLVAALGTTAIVVFVGIVVGRSVAALWLVLPLGLIVFGATVVAERRRGAAIRSTRVDRVSQPG